MSTSDVLGAPGATVRFATFLCDFIHKTNQVRKNGITIDEQYLRDRTINLITSNTGFRERSKWQVSRPRTDYSSQVLYDCRSDSTRCRETLSKNALLDFVT